MLRDFVALALGVATLVVAAGVVAMVVVAIERVWFIVLPRIIGRYSCGTPARCRMLGLIAAMPSLLGEPARISVRLELLRMLNHLGRAKEALEQGEKLLALKLPGILEANVRFRVADALETLGRSDESHWQRGRAASILKGLLPDATSLFASGRLKAAQGDHVGAIAEYTKAVEAAAPAEAETKAMALMGLSLSEFNTGKIDDAATHAALAAEIATDPHARISALRHASASYATQGDLEQSERYDRLACDLARETGNQKELANVLSHLGENLRKRGRLEDALEAVEQARQIEDLRACHTILHEIHRSAGRFEKALEELEIVSRTGALGLGRSEYKTQAIYDFGASRVLVDLNRIDQAAERVDQATRALAGDPKLALWCKAAAARIAALRGERDQAQALMAEVAASQGAFVSDRNTQLLCCALRARACQALGELDQAREAWEQYLAASPNLVDQPGVLYNLGECRLGQGDRAAAIDFYQRADALGLETHESNLARRRLAELGK